MQFPRFTAFQWPFLKFQSSELIGIVNVKPCMWEECFRNKSFSDILTLLISSISKNRSSFKIKLLHSFDLFRLFFLSLQSCMRSKFSHFVDELL